MDRAAGKIKAQGDRYLAHLPQGRTVLELNSMNTTHRKLFVALGLLAAGLFTAASAQEASQSKPESSADSRRFHFQIVVLFSSGFADSGLRQ